jgi:ketosteroid isomerase-like protein
VRLEPAPDPIAKVLAGYDAWNRSDIQGIVGMCDERIVIHPSGAFPDVSTAYHGHDGAKRFYEDIRTPFEEFRITPERLLRHRDTAFVQVRFDGRGREGIEVNATFTHVLTFNDDGLATRFLAFTGWDEALATLGVDEADAEAELVQVAGEGEGG